MKYFSLFTGIGGLDWGLEGMGAECVGFSEIKESSVRIYSRRYPGRGNVGDITKVDLSSLPDFDVLTGGFPCQSFSLAGMRRGFSDRRGQLIFYVYDVLREKKPEFAVLENVKGIVSHDGGRTFRNVFALLQAAGYFVRVVMLNAANYGSAQNRERVFFLCGREDFFEKAPVVMDRARRFRDVRQVGGDFRFLSDRAMARLERHRGYRDFVAVGGYDRVGTLTTGMSSSGRDRIVVQEGDGRFRYLTAVEGERLQGFPDGWTEGEREGDRWFAIGNAVNCRVSEYLFGDYLKGVWW